MAEGPYRAPGAPLTEPDARPTIRCPYCSAQCPADARRCGTCDVDFSRVRCPHCFGIQRIGSRECAACGAAMALEPLFDADGGPCPRCSRPLTLTRMQDVDLHECGACGGVFASHDALAALIAARSGDESLAKLSSGGPPDEDRNRLYVRCPQCDAVMNRSRFAPRTALIVDACIKHGVWFDGGELTQAVTFIARGGTYEAFRHRGRRPGDPKPSEPPARAQPIAAPAFGRSVVDTRSESTGAQLLIEMLNALLRF